MFVANEDVMMNKETKELANSKIAIFDFDGTLLNTNPWKQYEYLFRNPQRGTKGWMQGRKMYLDHVKDCPQWEGMDSVIDYIRHNKFKTCIVTANTKDRVVATIKAFGWKDVFAKENIIGCYALGLKRASKDNGDSSLFIKALEVLETKPEHYCPRKTVNNSLKAQQILNF